MMSVDPASLTLWQYQALLYTWNARHSPADEKPAPSPERLDRLKRAMAASVH